MKKRLQCGLAALVAATRANTLMAYLLIWSFALSAHLASGQTPESSPLAAVPATPANGTGESLPATPPPRPSALAIMSESDKDKSSTAAAETPASSPPLAIPTIKATEPMAVGAVPATRLPESHSPPETKHQDDIPPKAILLPDSQPANPSTSLSPPVLVSNDTRQSTREGSQNLAAQRSAFLGRLWQAIIEFHKSPGVIIFIVDFLVLCVVVGLLTLAATLGNYVWYPASLLVVFLYAWLQGDVDYFWVFALGMCTAFAEIIGKFRDEPLQSVRTGHAILYHIFNGVIAMFALLVLEIFAGPPNDAGQHLRNVLTAGLGAMLIMRSKLFNIKMGGEEVSFRPRIHSENLSFLHGRGNR